MGFVQRKKDLPNRIRFIKPNFQMNKGIGVMDKSVQQITDKVSLIASKNTWIEGLAIQQLIKTAELAGMERVAGMPDLHPGRGYPIGAAFFTRNKIYPALVGNDIGCGMALWQTSSKVAKVNLDKMAKQFKRLNSHLTTTGLMTLLKANARRILLTAIMIMRLAL